jgi:hypothetical protein
VEDVERPSFPWFGIAVGALAVFGAVALVRWVVGTVLWFFQMAVIAVLVVVVLRLVAGRSRR